MSRLLQTYARSYHVNFDENHSCSWFMSCHGLKVSYVCLEKLNRGSTFSCHWVWQLLQKRYHTGCLHLPGSPSIPIARDQGGSNFHVIVCLLHAFSDAVIEKFPLWAMAIFCMKSPLIPWRMKSEVNVTVNLLFLQNSEAPWLHSPSAHQIVSSRSCRGSSWSNKIQGQSKHNFC